MTSDVNRFGRTATAVILPAAPAEPAARRRERLATGVVTALVESIVGGLVRSGEALPPEGALAESFAVSRGTVREAVKLLEAKGLVEVRQGLGTVVRPGDDWNLLEPDVLAVAVRHEHGLGVLDELVGVRAALESMLAAQAATHASEGDLVDIAALYDQMVGETVRPYSFIETDAAFHERIMRASGSRLARTIVKTVHDQARASALYAGTPTTEGCLLSNDEHHAVLEHLRRRDGAAAAAAIRDHITSAWSRRRPGLPASTPAATGGAQ